MQESEPFPVNFGQTLPNSTNHIGRHGNLGFHRFGSSSLISATLWRHPCWHRHSQCQIWDKHIIHMLIYGQHFRRRHIHIHAILRHYVGPTWAAQSFADGAAKQNRPLPAHLPPYIVPSDTANQRAAAPLSWAARLPPAGVPSISPRRSPPPPSVNIVGSEQIAMLFKSK